MAVKLRLTRRGSKHRPYYQLVAANDRAPRDGAYLEQVGIYDPIRGKKLVVDAEKVQKWLAKGAQTTDTVKKLLKRAGVTGPQSAPESTSAKAAASAA